jgi:hypothetical protein
MSRPAWKLTVRSGSEVEHADFDDLGEAVAKMRERAMEIRAGAPPKTAELAGPGRFRKPVAGVDVRGDGTFVPFSGGVRREELDPSGHETPFDLVRETLEAQTR